jgi:hypothetical protein
MDNGRGAARPFAYSSPMRLAFQYSSEKNPGLSEGRMFFSEEKNLKTFAHAPAES